MAGIALIYKRNSFFCLRMARQCLLSQWLQEWRVDLQGAPKPIERPCAPGMAFCHGKPKAIMPLSVIEVMHLP
jgi:hypothetical protein